MQFCTVNHCDTGRRLSFIRAGGKKEAGRNEEEREKRQNVGETCNAYVISQHNSVSLLHSIVTFQHMQPFPAERMYKYGKIRSFVSQCLFISVTSVTFYYFVGVIFRELISISVNAD